MVGSPLRLETRAKQVDGIDYRGTNTTAGGSYAQRHPDGHTNIPLLETMGFDVFLDVGFLQVFECAKVDGRVRENSDEGEGEPTVETGQTALPRLLHHFDDEFVPTGSVLHHFALQTAGRMISNDTGVNGRGNLQLQSVDRIHGELRHNSTNSTSHEASNG